MYAPWRRVRGCSWMGRARTPGYSSSHQTRLLERGGNDLGGKYTQYCFSRDGGLKYTRMHRYVNPQSKSQHLRISSGKPVSAMGKTAEEWDFDPEIPDFAPTAKATPPPRGCSWCPAWSHFTQRHHHPNLGQFPGWGLLFLHPRV